MTDDMTTPGANAPTGGSGMGDDSQTPPTGGMPMPTTPQPAGDETPAHEGGMDMPEKPGETPANGGMGEPMPGSDDSANKPM